MWRPNAIPDKENLRLWVKALRSGDFKQGKGCLKNEDDTYCCLGVATKVAMENGVEVGEVFDWGQAGLPSAVQDWYGLRSANPAVGIEGPATGWGLCDAIGANDFRNLDFGQIADAIEKTYGL
jgi:hypothetical protein